MEEYADRSRAEGSSPRAMVTAATTRSSGLYLSRYATIMNAEEAAIMLAWAEASRVALGSQGAITRASKLG